MAKANDSRAPGATSSDVVPQSKDVAACNVLPFRPRLVVSNQPAPDAQTIELLRQLLEWAERGHVQGLCLLAKIKGEREHRRCRTGSYRSNNAEARGELLGFAWQLTGLDDE